MESLSGGRSFEASGDSYDRFMGRYSQPLAVAFSDFAGVVPGQSVLDAGCGPGALTGVLVDRVGPDSVSAFDPSERFTAVCADRHAGVDLRLGSMEAIPFDDSSFDVVLSQLVLHFVTDPVAAAAELHRVVRAGGLVGACVWDSADEMEMLKLFWDSAVEAVPSATDAARVLRFGAQGELAGWLRDSGFSDVSESSVEVHSTYTGFDDLWSGFQQGIGPAGTFCLSLPEESRFKLRRSMFDRLGRPDGEFTMAATARVATARRPGAGRG